MALISVVYLDMKPVFPVNFEGKGRLVKGQNKQGSKRASASISRQSSNVSFKRKDSILSQNNKFFKVIEEAEGDDTSSMKSED